MFLQIKRFRNFDLFFEKRFQKRFFFEKMFQKRDFKKGFFSKKCFKKKSDSTILVVAMPGRLQALGGR